MNLNDLILASLNEGENKMNLELNLGNFSKNLIKKKPRNFGITYLLRFENNYGASVIKNPYSYGGDRDLWELAVVKFDGDGENDYELAYDTPITDDVCGYLEDEGVINLLQEIKDLKEGE